MLKIWISLRLPITNSQEFVYQKNTLKKTDCWFQTSCNLNGIYGPAGPFTAMVFFMSGYLMIIWWCCHMISGDCHLFIFPAYIFYISQQEKHIKLFFWGHKDPCIIPCINQSPPLLQIWATIQCCCCDACFPSFHQVSLFCRVCVILMTRNKQQTNGQRGNVTSVVEVITKRKKSAELSQNSEVVNLISVHMHSSHEHRKQNPIWKQHVCYRGVGMTLLGHIE